MTGTTTLDLGPQARIVARLAVAVPDARLVDRTPCPAYTVGDLLGHLVGLCVAFRDAARKDLGATTDTPPGGAALFLPARWREDLPGVLGELAEAWQDPAAWTGMTRAGGVDLPGAIAGRWPLTSWWCTGGTWPGPPASSTYPIRPHCAPRTPSCWRPRRRRAAAGAPSGPSCPYRTTPRYWTGPSA